MSLYPIELDETYTVERSSITKVHGTPKKTWASVSSFEGTKRQLRQDEVFRMGKVDYNPTHRIYTENIDSDILVGDRIPYGTDYFYIHRIDNPHDLDEFLQIDAELRNE